MDDINEQAIATRPSLEDARNRSERNPFHDESGAVVRLPIGSAANAEQQRAVAEVQARMLIARAHPRNPIGAMDDILRDCTRPSLAKSALYQYSRGGQAVSGPSIRLMESIARRWGNIASGIVELSRSDGYSECKAYAWDLETGYYDERQFQVRHWRDTKGGGYRLTDERDIYELIANMGQRRKRSVLQTVIPGDVTEAAEEQCEQTLRTTVDMTPEALRRLADAFEPYGVTRMQLEKRIQCRLEAIRPAQVVQLRKIYMSLKDGMSFADDWFGDKAAPAWTEIERRHEASAEQQQTEKPARQQRAPRATRAADPNPTERTETPQNPPVTTATGPREAVAQPPESAQGVAMTPSGDSGGTPVPFEQWLLDEEGDPAKDAVITSAIEYARELEALWATSTRKRTLIEQNRDGMDAAAKADNRAAEIIASIDAPEEQAQQEFVVPIPDDRGRPNIGQYLRNFKIALESVDAPEFIDWIVANTETMRSTAATTRPLLIKAIVERAKALGVPTPAGLAEAMGAQQPAQPHIVGGTEHPGATLLREAPPESTAVTAEDRRIANNILDELGRCDTPIKVELYSVTQAVEVPRKRWRAEDKFALVDEITAAFEARHKGLGGRPRA